jgi:hypothetical protein
MSLNLLKAAGLALTAVLLATGAVFAAPPPLPFSPYGTVKVNNANVVDGTVISAWCGGVSYRQTNTVTTSGASWYFNLDIPGDDPETSSVKEGCTSNETVSFKIGDLTASQTAPWVSGSAPRLDLTATGGNSPTPTNTPVAAATSTSTPTGTPTPTATTTGTPTNTPTPTATGSSTPTPSITPTPRSGTGQISGWVYIDSNKNGVRDTNETIGPKDVKIVMVIPGGEVISTLSAAPDGRYQFGNLVAGTYQLSEVQPKGYAGTSPDSMTVVLTAGAQKSASFGEYPSATKMYLPLVLRKR